MTAQKTTGRSVSIPRGLATGAIVSAAATILISAIGAHLILSGFLQQEQIGYCSIAAILTGTILGSITANGKIKRRKLMVCMLSGCVYYLMLLATTALFFGGQYQGVGVTFLVVLLGSLTAALITNRNYKSRTGYVRKKSFSKIVQH